ncbi:hypothetical protein GOZ78_02125 [Agrobacterium vitis]|uniref:Uncharacterized protein n=1 Tax=Agrobacterium vitis TaxID=373 RepID=A0ABD6GE51_AGRVI|nr:hypothetical protein [Agrobacterium vitis]MUO77693.1 hypothetical protein [Agrobacterium vitis]MUO93210.1 hypothetical protein [Agrobacterium vitis]MUP04561.1 hypothetical protein [Agrobacterium vitis]MUZ81001.1 hypothetical protein [Agrobacterium vitis]MVA08813.1 hypothetical protein [Agrobacterium vitis]
MDAVANYLIPLFLVGFLIYGFVSIRGRQGKAIVLTEQHMQALRENSEALRENSTLLRQVLASKEQDK